jgi:hypothetical protein
MNPLVPTFSEAVLSFGPLVLLLLAALGIVYYYASRAYLNVKSKAFLSGARGKSAPENHQNLK